MKYDVVIVGGGPAGLSAALTLGRARKKVLLCDAGTPRNAAAEQIHGYLTRDGTPPTEFRGIGRQQLQPYPSVEVRDVRVETVKGERGALQVALATGEVEARRVLLCTGMVDEMMDIEGYAALWGRSIFQCPYCHGWESRERSFGLLAQKVELLDLAILLRSWTSRVVALTNGGYPLPPEQAQRLARAGVPVDERKVKRLVASGDRLEQVEFVQGAPLLIDLLFSRPPQRQVGLVQALGLALDAHGFVQVDDVHGETSRPGIHAAGDLVTPIQGAILAAASGMRGAAQLNHGLTAEMVSSGSDSLSRKAGEG